MSSGALGQTTIVRGRVFQTFGLLFLGAYVGGVLGSALAVGLFGQTQWVVPITGVFWHNGIVYNDTSNSLVTILEAVNPISALPFLPFFGLTLSQIGETSEFASPMSQNERPGNSAT